MKALIQQLENNLVHCKKLNATISASPVEWHIDHCLRVINNISKVMAASKEEDYKSKFNFARTLVFTLGTIPRGKAKAPKAVRAQQPITETDLKNEIQKANNNIDQIENLLPNQYFMHPYFGKLNAKQTIKFLKIHTKHHSKIIKDIVAKR